ncbi:MAG TPA: Swt1 family HEPN domain-containing protein [Gemmatimonadales bacterium]|nr:Swt1 family HEPN domain-containing protein [Gemmatimonadales bacterium]
MNNDLYTFVYRGILTDESLDKAGRKTRVTLGTAEVHQLKGALSFELLDAERVSNAEKMAIIYTAIHAFENTVRHFVAAAMAETHHEEWWSKVPAKVQSRAQTRIEEEAKFRWHGARGGAEIEYCDFGDLLSIIVVNWAVFEDVLVDMEWVKATLSVLERSRNIVMHGGMLARQDVERIGINIRDWLRQAG